MFALQRSVFDRLVQAGMPEAWVNELASALANIYSHNEHEGTVQLRTSQQGNALELANYAGHGQPGEVSGNALYVSKGPGVTGDPKPGVIFEDGPIPPDTYHSYWNGLFDNYQTGNYPWTHNDDLRLNDYVKYGIPAHGSTILRVEFLTAFSGQPGSVAKARLIDENLQPVGGPAPQDGAGNPAPGWGVFDVKDVLGMAGAMSSACSSTQDSGRGYALYMSDRAPGGAKADNSTRKATGKFELLSFFRKSTTGSAGTSIDVVTDVNFNLANCQLSVTKTQLTLGGGSCT